MFISILPFIYCCSSDDPVSKPDAVLISITPQSLELTGQAENKVLQVSSNADWEVVSSQSWCKVTPSSGSTGAASVTITVEENTSGSPKTAELTFKSGSYTATYSISQPAKIIAPAGYQLVWNDEFNASRLSGGRPALPATTNWSYETGNNGWGNNELQKHISGFSGTDTCAVVTDGKLKIIAKKVGNQVLSIRMNTRQSWKYGYFEARLKLPKGKGTWPAFWMLPKNFTAWPDDGEIDIMEEVGYNANYVSSSIHCKAYNHSIGTQKTKEILLSTAQTEFHVYALEWTEDYIKTFVDGKELFYFANDKTGNKNTWPFNAPFYLKLNLAWGGNWGGAQGVDESVLPATYEIDYVRVFQK